MLGPSAQRIGGAVITFLVHAIDIFNIIGFGSISRWNLAPSQRAVDASESVTSNGWLRHSFFVPFCGI